jgi:hypothetical protein
MTAPAADLMLPAAGIGVWPGAVVSEADGLRFVCGTGAVHPDSVRDPAGAYHPVEHLYLDLTHRMTRLEVMARLGERLNWRRGAQVGWVCIWMHPPDDATERERRMYEDANRTWRLIAVADNLMQDWAGRTLRNQTSTCTIPALAELNPADDTRLPDGARRVDVQALAIVAAHVSGSASSRPG